MRAEAGAFLCGLVVACRPPAGVPPEGTARVIRDERAVSAGAALAPADLACITGPDPELDRESPWSVSRVAARSTRRCRRWT